MTTEQFAYWLQGFAEVNGAPPNSQQWDVIKEHLQLCFVKVTGSQTKLPGIEEFIKQQNQQKQGNFPYVVGTGYPLPHPTTITC